MCRHPSTQSRYFLLSLSIPLLVQPQATAWLSNAEKAWSGFFVLLGRYFKKRSIPVPSNRKGSRNQDHLGLGSLYCCSSHPIPSNPSADVTVRAFLLTITSPPALFMFLFFKSRRYCLSCFYFFMHALSIVFSYRD